LTQASRTAKPGWLVSCAWTTLMPDFDGGRSSLDGVVTAMSV